ncbi:hypothetical protein LXG23DRAFT_36932 [Yarrowia lipolytica]|nr:hypothetical protein LXG23DRAFT_36932 [Yarrowia lipolytica]
MFWCTVNDRHWQSLRWRARAVKDENEEHVEWSQVHVYMSCTVEDSVCVAVAVDVDVAIAVTVTVTVLSLGLCLFPRVRVRVRVRALSEPLLTTGTSLKPSPSPCTSYNIYNPPSITAAKPLATT